MEQKIEPVKTWEMRFAEIGISEDMLREAKISSEFYDYLFALCQVPVRRSGSVDNGCHGLKPG